MVSDFRYIQEFCGHMRFAKTYSKINKTEVMITMYCNKASSTTNLTKTKRVGDIYIYIYGKCKCIDVNLYLKLYVKFMDRERAVRLRFLDKSNQLLSK